VYFPYLHARQMELLALRDNATLLVGWKTAPVLEPVRTGPRDLLRCLGELERVGAPCYVIVNPHRGDFDGGMPRSWATDVHTLVASSKIIRPAFQVSRASTRAGLRAFLAAHAGRPVGVVVHTAEIAAVDLRAEVAASNALVFLHARSNPGMYRRTLTPGTTVEVEECFNPQDRNADYSGEEWFTSSHLNYRGSGLPGFSDFGPLPPTFSLSGGQAAAVAIHLTYRNATDGSLWVEHFVSDSTDIGDGDRASKMAEATAKVTAAVHADPAKFVRTAGLQAFLTQSANGTPTDLGTSKRQQLCHHLATVGPLV